MLNRRVYGLIGISSIMSNWNADFSGYPKTTSNGYVFGSDKALKYPMKKMWDEMGEKVLYIKSLKIDNGKDKKKKNDKIEIRPKSLKERYEELFETIDKDTKKVLENLFKATDVKQFGATFAEEKNNISITGAVQINQGFNKYSDHTVEQQQILSPFRNSKNKKDKETNEEKEDDSSTLGTKIVSSEAHYVYSFSINPLAYKDFVKMGVTEGYTEKDYSRFKDAALISATSFDTNAKVGCENEFGIFIEGDNNLYLPDLSQYVEFKKEEDKDGKYKNIIILNFVDLLNSLDNRIEKIEIYYNPYKAEIQGKLKKAKYFNIFTKEEVK